LLASYFVKGLIPYRRDFIFLVLAVGISTGVVSLLKHVTNIHCPKELALFGHDLPYIRLFEMRNTLSERGICWPGGHASGGFAFWSLYFVARRYGWQCRAMLFWLGLVLGLVYGSARMIQGLHFMSHNLWSGLICWLIMVLLSMWLYRQPAGDLPVNN
jgi:membrane-associated PAP2 superfamily phosphatase